MMVSKEMVGNRIRQIRQQQRKTLKDVEAHSGFSSTHISEIERGRTSPTIGALLRIARALDKDPSYFIEERELDEVCITSPESRPTHTPGLELRGQGFALEALTRGVLGGRLLTFELSVEPGAEVTPQKLPEAGDVCIVCLEGECRLVIGEKPVPFTAGSSLHLSVEEAKFSLQGGEMSAARILVVFDPKEAISS
jgi:transcriptional regulator with XRE-family HTH domain